MQERIRLGRLENAGDCVQLYQLLDVRSRYRYTATADLPLFVDVDGGRVGRGLFGCDWIRRLEKSGRESSVRPGSRLAGPGVP